MINTLIKLAELLDNMGRHDASKVVDGLAAVQAQYVPDWCGMASMNAWEQNNRVYAVGAYEAEDMYTGKTRCRTAARSKLSKYFGKSPTNQVMEDFFNDGEVYYMLVSAPKQ